MAWEKAQETKQESLAYISKETKEAMKDNPQIAEIANALLDKATEIMDKVSEAGLTTESQTRDKSKTYTDKMVVKVEPAVKYNKDTKEEEPMLHKDGSPVMSSKLELSHNGTQLTLFAKEDVSDGVKLTAMTAQKWERPRDSMPKLKIYKADEIQSAYINKDIKAIAAEIQKDGFLEEKAEPVRSLKSVAYEANQYFNANSEKVQNDKGELVNDAYAQYDSDYDKVMLRNHSDNIVVELGTTNDGDKYALAMNFDINENGSPRGEGEQPAKAYINNAKDLAAYIPNQEIKDIVSDFKGISQKEQAKEQPKKDKAAIEH